MMVNHTDSFHASSSSSSAASTSSSRTESIEIGALRVGPSWRKSSQHEAAYTNTDSYSNQAPSSTRSLMATSSSPSASLAATTSTHDGKISPSASYTSTHMHAHLNGSKTDHKNGSRKPSAHQHSKEGENENHTDQQSSEPPPLKFQRIQSGQKKVSSPHKNLKKQEEQGALSGENLDHYRQMLGTRTMHCARGLDNLGQSCFLNSVVQAAFFHNPIMLYNFLIAHPEDICQASRNEEPLPKEADVDSLLSKVDQHQSSTAQKSTANDEENQEAGTNRRRVGSCLACEMSRAFHDCILFPSGERSDERTEAVNKKADVVVETQEYTKNNEFSSFYQQKEYDVRDKFDVRVNCSPIVDNDVRASELAGVSIFGAMGLGISAGETAEQKSHGDAFALLLDSMIPASMKATFPSWMKQTLEALVETAKRKSERSRDTGSWQMLTGSKHAKVNISSHRPKRLYAAFREVAPSLANGEQQDAHECYSALLDSFYEAQRNAQKYVLKEMGKDTEQLVTSFIEPFEGQLVSRRSCTHCGETITKAEKFRELSLQLRSYDKSQNAQETSENVETEEDQWKLQTLLANFSSPEVLSENEKVHCSKCEALRDAQMQLAIRSLPSVLCLHLKRFEHIIYNPQDDMPSTDVDAEDFAEDYTGERRTRKRRRAASSSSGPRIRHRKVNTHVSFKVRGLDLSCCVEDKVFADGQKDSKKTYDPDDCKYDLFGLVEHTGSLNRGHYIAYVRAPCKGYNISTTTESHDSDPSVSFVPEGPYMWFKYDDSKVSRVAEEYVLQRNAYMLYYIRRKDSKRLGVNGLSEAADVSET